MIGGRGDVSYICEKNEKDIQNLKPYDQKEPLWHGQGVKTIK